MKNKKVIGVLILVGVLAVFFVGACIFFGLQGLSAAEQMRAYFNVYREKAEDYVRSDSAMLAKYGDDMTVVFDDMVTYSESGERGVLERYVEVFCTPCARNA